MAAANVNQQIVIKLELSPAEAGLICDALQNQPSKGEDAGQYWDREHIYTVLKTALKEVPPLK